MNNQQSHVFIAMSGGVDSSVCALLLQQQGFQISGITMQVSKEMPVNPDAEKICSLLGIPHHLLDVSGDFSELVISNLKKEYALGRTPNPCIVCNRHIKFGLLLETAKKMGADFIATGHYADIQKTSYGYTIARGSDNLKDQSYFLYGIPSCHLPFIKFPLAGMEKKEVRRLAEENHLPVFNSSDSQGICFLANSDYKSFLAAETEKPFNPGPVKLVSGEIIGRHKGIHCYTIGQRKGLGIGWKEPLYVEKIDTESNTVFVAPAGSRGSDEISFTVMNLFFPEKYISGLNGISMKYRHVCRELEVRECFFSGKICRVVLKNPAVHIPAGQSAVLYNKNFVLGGGIII